MDNKDRKPGYYWITAWGERMIAKWDTYKWQYAGSDMGIPKDYVTDVNENR